MESLSANLISGPEQPASRAHGRCTSSNLLERVEFLRLDASRQLARPERGEYGQFLTPEPVARLMASMFSHRSGTVSILDAGAGVGSLFAAAVAHLCSGGELPAEVGVTAYEIDPLLLPYLSETMALCKQACEVRGIRFTGTIRPVDFLRETASLLSGGLFADRPAEFTMSILNPPYRKIHAESDARHQLRCIGPTLRNPLHTFQSSTLHQGDALWRRDVIIQTL